MSKKRKEKVFAVLGPAPGSLTAVTFGRVGHLIQGRPEGGNKRKTTHAGSEIAPEGVHPDTFAYNRYNRG
jgi:hypothetical protein